MTVAPAAGAWFPQQPLELVRLAGTPLFRASRAEPVDTGSAHHPGRTTRPDAAGPGGRIGGRTEPSDHAAGRSGS
ncbi:hypothetical protein ACGFU4_11625 [Streptomyces sp. NPDC048511]|uniref:hypothetical protein n=1 Tax=Streptomyces sp. NPDC048511 TaxID=3365562 RepID=UPI0037232CB4